MTCVVMTQNDAALDESLTISVKDKGYSSIIMKFFERFHRTSYWSKKGASSRSTRSKHPPVCEAC
jgi:hypothetical protein